MIWRCAFLVLACSVLAGCPRPHKNESVYKTVQMGNPMKLVEGTERDTDFFKEDYLKNGESLWLVGATSFEKIGRYKNESRNLKKENAARANPTESTDTEQEREKYIVTKNERGVVITGTMMKIELIKSGPETQIVYTVGDKTSVTSTLAHFSFNPSRTMFTILSYDAEGTKDESVSYLLFQKFPPGYKELKPNTKYHYLKGPGLYIRWPLRKKIPVQTCGPNINRLSDVITLAADKWNDILPADQQLELSHRRIAKPFSDLNQHCIYLIDDFLTSAHPDYANYGQTWTIDDNRTLEIVDSDILLFTGEFSKAASQTVESELGLKINFTAVHELGHYLGLSHQFDPNVPSVMSYDFKTPGITDYDREAIQELYK